MMRKSAKKEPQAVLSGLFPAYKQVDSKDQSMVDLPGCAGSYFGVSGSIRDSSSQLGQQTSTSFDEMEVDHRLPQDRFARYAIYECMAEDPTIECAISMHVGNALSAKSDTGEIITVESKESGNEAIVDDIRSLINTHATTMQEWAYKAAVYGAHYVRAYGEPGTGITGIRSDYYTQARFIKKFEQGGQLVGYTSSYQGIRNQIRMLPPWTFVGFEVPRWKSPTNIKPNYFGTGEVDLSMNTYDEEPITESSRYGTSLFETAYGPWCELLEAIVSLGMSRKNAARLERIIGINTGNLDPAKAAKYLDLTSQQLKTTSDDMSKKSWRKGFVQTVVNHLISLRGDNAKGNMSVETVQGTPDINGIEDVRFQIQRLGAGLGIDPALLGFGEYLSGGLGDGGFFRVSLMASIKAQLLRQAMLQGIQRMCEIHVAYKYNKVFIPGEHPWRIIFNSVSSAIEREAQENFESRANLASSISGTMSLLDQEGSVTDKRELMRYIFMDVMQTTEERFDAICPKGKAEETAAANANNEDEYEE